MDNPYIINVKNTTDKFIGDVDILGSFEYVQSNNHKEDGVFLNLKGVEITSGLYGVTYRDLLFQLMNNPIHIGKTKIICKNGKANQIAKPFRVVTQDANGNKYSKMVVPVISPFYERIDIIDILVNYSIDGFTKITEYSLEANSEIEIQFYPYKDFNPNFKPKLFKAFLTALSIGFLTFRIGVLKLFKNKF